MTAAAEVPQQKGAIARLLDFIEVAGNKVPHPVLMFLYLIIGVIDPVVGPRLRRRERDRDDRRPGRATWSSPTTTRTPPTRARTRATTSTTATTSRSVTIPIRALISVEGIRFIFTSFVAQLRRVRRGRGDVHRADGRGRRRGRRPDGRPDPEARVGLAEAAARLHPRARRDHVVGRVGRGLPDPRPAGRRGVRLDRAAPAGRARGVLRGVGLGVRREPDPRARSTR